MTEISTFGEIVLTLESSVRDAVAVKSFLDRLLCKSEWHLALAAEEWGEFNSLLPTMLRQRIEERRTILLKTEGLRRA